jgi:hypothetical protein
MLSAESWDIRRKSAIPLWRGIASAEGSAYIGPQQLLIGIGFIGMHILGLGRGE